MAMDKASPKSKMSKSAQEDFLHEARNRHREAEAGALDHRKSANEALSFVSGDQWFQENLRTRKDKELRPCLTVNLLSQFVRIVANEAHRSKPAIKVVPVDDHSDPGTAEILQDIIRQIERNSDSSIAYGTATDYQVRCGLGYFGFQTRYAHAESMDQIIELRAFHNPDAVLPDPYSNEFDGSDSQFYFVDQDMSREQYKRDFPEFEVENFEGSRILSDWSDNEKIRVAEYWYVKTETRKLVQLTSGQVMLLKSLKRKFRGKDVSSMIHMERDVEHRTVHRALINGQHVLETDDWPGSWIPIIPVFGEVLVVNGKRRIFGLVEHAYDSQRMVNYFYSCAAELVALAPKAPWVAAFGQIEPHKQLWQNANTVPQAVLPYTPEAVGEHIVPPPQRTTFDPPIGNLISAIQISEAGLRNAVGLHGPSIGAVSSERSGRAINALQERGSISTYHFVDNFAKSLRFGAQQLIGDGEHHGLIQKVYNQPGRVMRITGGDDAERLIGLGKRKSAVPQEAQDHKDYRGIFDLSTGRYDVSAEVGQAFASQRQEAFAAMSQIFQSAPQLLERLGDLWLKSADFPEAREMSKRLRMMLPPHLRGEDPNISPEAGEIIQQLQGQMQGMFQTVQQQAQELETKRQDRESKERIEALKGKLKSAEILGSMVAKPDGSGVGLVQEMMMALMEASRQMAELQAIEPPPAPPGPPGGPADGPPGGPQGGPPPMGPAGQ